MNTSEAASNSTSPHLTQNAYVGYILAICGNLLISVSLNIQKHVHMNIEKMGIGSNFLHMPLWWMAISLFGLGEIGNFSAYGFASPSSVAPLGTVAVVASMVIACFVLNEKIRPEDLFGSSFALVGSILILNFSKKHQEQYGAEDLLKMIINISYIIFASIDIVLLLLLLVLYHRFKVNSVVVVLLIAALMASFTIITAKGLSGMIQLTIAGIPQWKYPILYVFAIIMGVTCIGQVFYLNLAMRDSAANVVVPINFVFFSLSAVLSGVIFYNDFKGLSAFEIAMFIFGCGLSFVGVFFIQLNRKPSNKNEIEVAPSASVPDLSFDFTEKKIQPNVEESPSLTKPDDETYPINQPRPTYGTS